MFREYLHFCLVDDKLENKEIISLRYIGEILLLRQIDIEKEIKIETEKIYKKHIEDALQDSKLSENEKRKLERLKKDLLISETLAKKINQKSAKVILNNLMEGLVSDKMLSPEEEQEFREITKYLGINENIKKKTKETLDRYKLYWQIGNGDLPEITTTSSVVIQRNEKFHFKVIIKWKELKRKVRTTMNYSGMNFQAAKSFGFSGGTITPRTEEYYEYDTIDSGDLYLSNQRILFVGSSRGFSKEISFDELLNVKHYRDGIDINQRDGTVTFLEFSPNTDIFYLILTRLIEEWQQKQELF